MSDKHEEQVAGVTLHFKSSSLVKPQGDEKFRVDLVLDCSVRDEELWRGVEKKFKEGYRVFTSEDFHMEVLDVVRQDYKTLESRLLHAERELRKEKDHREQLEAELAKYKEPLATFGAALRGGR